MHHSSFMKTMAQICVIIILLPFIISFLGLVFGNSSSVQNMVGELINNIPFFEIWSSLLWDIGTGGTDAEAIAGLSMYIFAEAFFEAVILGICVHIMKRIGDALPGATVGILATFFGVIAGSVVLNITQSLGDSLVPIIADIIIIVIMIIGIRIMFTLKFPGKEIFSLKKILVIIIEGLVAVVICGYLTMLTLVFNGFSASPKDAIFDMLSMSAVLAIALVILYFVDKGTKDIF